VTLHCQLCRVRHNLHYAEFGFMPHSPWPTCCCQSERTSDAA